MDNEPLPSRLSTGPDCVHFAHFRHPFNVQKIERFLLRKKEYFLTHKGRSSDPRVQTTTEQRGGRKQCSEDVLSVWLLHQTKERS